MHVQMKGKDGRKEQQVWHMAIVIFFSLMSIITTAAAVRLIINNTKMYHFFANI